MLPIEQINLTRQFKKELKLEAVKLQNTKLATKNAQRDGSNLASMLQGDVLKKMGLSPSPYRVLYASR